MSATLKIFAVSSFYYSIHFHNILYVSAFSFMIFEEIPILEGKITIEWNFSILSIVKFKDASNTLKIYLKIKMYLNAWNIFTNFQIACLKSRKLETLRVIEK